MDTQVLRVGLPTSSLARPARHFRAKLRRNVPLVSDTQHLEWTIVDSESFQFRAGQFISAVVQFGSQSEIRPYSIASPPRNDLSFELCINRVNGGYVSNYLCDLKLDSIVDFKGPYGSFVVTQPIDRDLVFLATGTGVAPFRSILLDLFAQKAEIPHEVWLIFGVRFPDGLLYQADFEMLQREHSKFHFVPVVSRPSEKWKAATGRVQDQLRTLFAGRNDIRAYVCGVKLMVEEIRGILSSEFGLAQGQIRSEKFA